MNYEQCIFLHIKAGEEVGGSFRKPFTCTDPVNVSRESKRVREELERQRKGEGWGNERDREKHA